MTNKDIDLNRLPPKPKIDEANYGWTGKFGSEPCLLIGDKSLKWDGKTFVLDTRNWDSVHWSGAQVGRAERFLKLAREMGDFLLIYVYEDIGTEVTSTGEHLSKRGKPKFTGLFEVERFEKTGFLAKLVRRTK